MKKILALLISLVVLLSMVPVASAESYTDSGSPCVKAAVFMDSFYSTDGCLFIDTYYMPLDELCRKAGIAVKATHSDDVYELTGDGFTMKYQLNDHYIMINHRYYYSEVGYPCVNGKAYVNVGLAESLFGVTASINNYCIEIHTGGISRPENNENYYEDTYGEETIWWLSHIIQAEGYYEGLEGHIGIGNVVMNRVACNAFPDTVKDVVLDTANGVQFDTVLNENFETEEPSELSMIATYIALEGESVVEDSLFFIVPDGCNPKWFDNNLERVTDIDNLRFYRSIN